MLSLVQLFVTPWTVDPQDPPLSIGVFRQYWSGLPFPPPADLPHAGTEPSSLTSALADGFSAALAALQAHFSCCAAAPSTRL